MNLNPFTVIILLDFDWFFFKPVQIFQSFDPLLESFLFSFIQTHQNHILADLVKFEPEYSHDNEHDEVEKGKLEDYEEAVGDEKQHDKSNWVVEQCFANAGAFDWWVVFGCETLVESFELIAAMLFDNCRKVALVLVCHLKSACCIIPKENFLDSRGTWTDFSIFSINLTSSCCKLHILAFILLAGSKQLCLLLLLYLIGHFLQWLYYSKNEL